MFFTKILLSISLFLLFCSCIDESVAIQNDGVIENYILENNLTAEKTDRGLYYIINNFGTVDTSRVDSVPSSTSFMDVMMTGSLLDGTVFYSAEDSSSLLVDLANSVTIDGLKTGLPLFNRGGEGILLVPSSLAYGSGGIPGLDVPADVPIRFDVMVNDFYQSEEAYNDTVLVAYMAKNNIQADTSSDGTYIVDLQLGIDSTYATTTSTLLINYRVTLLDGTEIYSSLENVEPDILAVSSQYEGFQDVIHFCNSGSSATFLIPSHKALGSRTDASISAYSQLRYDVVIVSIL